MAPKDLFEQIQSDLYGVSMTQQQLQEMYSQGTSDGWTVAEQSVANPSEATDTDPAQTSASEG